MSATSVLALWWGGHSYVPADPVLDVEQFPTLGAALDAFQERYESNGQRRVTFRFVNREHESCLVPVVGQESTMLLFERDPEEDEETDLATTMPDRIITFGPRGAVHVGPPIE